MRDGGRLTVAAVRNRLKDAPVASETEDAHDPERETKHRAPTEKGGARPDSMIESTSPAAAEPRTPTPRK